MKVPLSLDSRDESRPVDPARQKFAAYAAHQAWRGKIRGTI
ncbi:MAG: hypothetical protein OEV01_10995 [Nitrospira sp.]|nr:hypothetical protein [Nitrospira sp.]MDH4303789.1 hypothetical protein [Nitrospira sp.]